MAEAGGAVSGAVPLPFEEIARRLKRHAPELPAVDVVYGIARGGVVPAALVAYELERPLELLHINYRADDNTPQRDAPEVLAPARLPSPGMRVLLVDDVAVTGRTLERARKVLAQAEVTTLAMKGRADVVLFPEVASCVVWPWKGDASLIDGT